eukprot:maker-scaffold171_size289870-snap-gene-1.43 protein:Tk00429 transcript:maker-scaffold171_size289870-snap-gene-1.43-mRNA-1 annotation:"protein shroom isoform x1"
MKRASNTMASSSSFVLESFGINSSKENYSKVVLKKEMVMSVADQETRDLSSMSLVQRRISEMSKSGDGSEPADGKVAQTRERFLPTSKQGQFNKVYAPRPYSGTSSSNGTVTKMAKLDPVSSAEYRPEIPPRRTTKNESNSSPKPELPPKPRNLRTSKGSMTDILEDETEAGGGFKVLARPAEILSEDSDRVTPIPKRFQSKSISYSHVTSLASMDRKALLERRRSYSEFQDLIQKKGEIRERILSKIHLLRDEREMILEEKRVNDSEGQAILDSLEARASSTEVDKVYKYLQEVEQITKLTVGLQIRLNRTTKLASRLDVGPAEKENLNSKTAKLIDQITEAQSLQMHTNRRGHLIRSILKKHFSLDPNQQDQLERFEEFLSILVFKITELKEMDQRVQQGEEQITVRPVRLDAFRDEDLGLYELTLPHAITKPGGCLRNTVWWCTKYKQDHHLQRDQNITPPFHGGAAAA